MGKSVTVRPGFSFIEGPGSLGRATYQAGAVIVYTDDEYAALNASTLRCLSAPPVTVPDPSRPDVPGLLGIPGPKGDPGSSGAPGVTGPQGIQGVQGPQGSYGLTGPTGAQGVEGAPGLPGVPGVAGPQGIPGQQGSSGLTGPQGAYGLTGPQGPQGEQGINPGAAEAHFSVPSDQWIFNHNLGYAPAVMTYDNDGVVITGQIVENTEFRTVVDWYYPMTGLMSVS